MTNEMTNAEKKTFSQNIIDAMLSFAKLFTGWNGIGMVQRIALAISNTRVLEGTKEVPLGYAYDVWTKHINDAAGSTFSDNFFKVELLIRKLFLDVPGAWMDFTKELPEGILIPGCTYLSAYIPKVGVLRASAIKKYIDEGFGSRKVSIVKSITGHYEVQMDETSEITTDLVTLILGPAYGKEIIYTIHPGRPLETGNVNETQFTEDAFETTLEEAYKYGFRTVKYVTLKSSLVQSLAMKRCGLGCRQYYADEQKRYDSEKASIRAGYDAAIDKAAYIAELEREL